MNIFVNHYSPLKERKIHILNSFKEAGIENFKFIEEEPDGFFLDKYDDSICSWRLKTSCLNYGGHIRYRRLSSSEISLFYKHFLCFTYMQKSNCDISLILEDDVLFPPDILKNINSILEEVEDDWDFIFLGNGCNLKISEDRIKIGKKCYLKSHPATKCTDSFLIKKSSSYKILKEMESYSLPIDFELNYILYKNNMKCYWIEPPIVTQGSQNGIFDSKIQ